jgi:hypothetical protein
MRYKTKTKQSLAALTALVMFTSVLAMGFAGTAAANAQDIENFDAEDVVAGTSSVNQTVTVAGLENDNSSEIITITANITPNAPKCTKCRSHRRVDRRTSGR